MSQQPYPDEHAWWGGYYEPEVRRRYEAAGRQFPDPNDPAAFRWFARCAYDIAAGMTKEASAAKHLDGAHGLSAELGLLPTPEPTPDKVCRPIAGYVRTEGGPRQWFDDSGPRSFRICSWFPALRCFRDNPDGVRRELDRIAVYWQGIRIFTHLGTNYWVEPGYNVDPRWPDFDQVFNGFARECQARGLRLSLTTGDMQVLCPDGNEEAHHRRIAELAASIDQLTVSWFSIWNEGWQNSVRGREPGYAARMSEIIQHIYPWGAHGLSDPEDNEEPAALDAYSQHPANFTLKHGSRDWPGCMNRTYNTVYEGHWLLNEDEPSGFGPDVFAPLQRPAQLFGLHTLTLLTGQMLTFFGGHGLKSWRDAGDLEKDWGFRELPELWAQMQIPEDVRGWTLVPGHKAESAVYPLTFENPGGGRPLGPGPHRCDGIQTYEESWHVVSAGRDRWDLRTRRNCDVTIWRASGPEHLGVLGREAAIPNGGPSEDAIVIHTRRV